MSRWLIAVGGVLIACVDGRCFIEITSKKSGIKEGRGLIFEGGVFSGWYGSSKDIRFWN